jgi:hypothetical protein
VLLHGLWDFFIFLLNNLRTVAVARCLRVLSDLPQPPPAAAGAPSSSSDSSAASIAAALDECADADAQVADLLDSIAALSICALVAAVVLPAATAYVCHKRLQLVRKLEARGGGAPRWTPPAVLAPDEEAGTLPGGATAPGYQVPPPAQPLAWPAYDAAPAQPHATDEPAGEPPLHNN